MMAVFALQPPCEPGRASVVVDATAPVLRRLIASASAFLNSAGRNASAEVVVDEAEAVINAILDAKPLTRAPETPTAPKSSEHGTGREDHQRRAAHSEEPGS